MNERFTPTTEQVRLDYVMAYSEKESSQIVAERDFDCWLAERDRQVAEEAWAEGFRAGDGIGAYSNREIAEANPYRKE